MRRSRCRRSAPGSATCWGWKATRSCSCDWAMAPRSVRHHDATSARSCVNSRAMANVGEPGERVAAARSGPGNPDSWLQLRPAGPTNRKPRTSPPGVLVPLTRCRVWPVLLGLDFFSLQALLALRDLEGDLLAFLERLEAAALDRAEMDEQVVAALRGDEAEALGIVEPLDGSGLAL